MHRSLFTTIRAIAAVVTVSAAVCALPAGASAADQLPSAARGTEAAQQPSKSVASLVTQSRKAPSSRASLAGWGFNAQLWSYTIADPWGANRVYYYNKCKPKPNVRFFKMSSHWIYRTYECWAILA